MAIELEQTPTISEGDVDIVAVDCSPYLDGGELLASVSQPVEQTTSDLTLANQSVSTTTLEILESEVAIGKALLFSVAGQQSGQQYTVRVTATTNSTPARTKNFDIKINVA
jgi:hypothetical protein